MKITFVFFWIGKEIDIPDNLVRSIRAIYKNEAIIFQVSDLHTKRVGNIDEVYRYDENFLIPEEIMLARLRAFSLINNNFLTIFIDADAIVINKINLTIFNKEKIYVVKREEKLFNAIINHDYPIYYPEFVGKKMGEVMPLMAGCLIAKNSSSLFNKLFMICKNSHIRFHRWYGDQTSLFQYWKENKNDFLYLDYNEYCYTVQKLITNDQAKNLISSNVKIIQFKGPAGKKDLIENSNIFFKFLN